MGEFVKDCPVCNKRFTSIVEYMTHLGKDHGDIPPDIIEKMNKEEKWKFGNK